MTTAITLAGWFLIFGAYFALAFLIAAFFYGAFRTDREERDFETHSRPRLGVPSSPVKDFTSEREARIARANFRHLTRHGKDAA